ncbi:uncharacterized protein LOC144359431 [Saccoglossus kowalevskii]
MVLSDMIQTRSPTQAEMPIDLSSIRRDSGHLRVPTHSPVFVSGCMCPSCPLPPSYGQSIQEKQTVYRHMSPPITARTRPITVIQNTVPLTSTAASRTHLQTRVVPSHHPRILTDSRFETAAEEITKRKRDCCLANEYCECRGIEPKKSRLFPLNYIPQQNFYGNTAVTPSAVVSTGTDPRSSLLIAADCHLATLQDEDGDTPLHIAVVQSNLQLVEKLIYLITLSGKSVDIFNNLRQTPLHLAVITNQWQMTRLLILGGADGNLTDRNGQTAVHLSCQRSNMECLHSILTCSTHVIELDSKNYEGYAALHLAVQSGNQDMITFLLSKGAAIECQDGKSGRTPLFHAVENSQEHIIELLLKHNGDVNAQSYSGNTPLHVASGRGLLSIVRLLLRNGADMSMRNYHCDTAANVAKDTSVSKMMHQICNPISTVTEKNTIPNPYASRTVIQKAEANITAVKQNRKKNCAAREKDGLRVKKSKLSLTKEEISS